MSEANPYRQRMEMFGDRLRRLVAEAWQEGIVLMTQPATGDVVDMPPLDGQEVLQIAAPVPHFGHMHFNLKMPPTVVVYAVVVNDAEGNPTSIVPSFLMPMPSSPKI